MKRILLFVLFVLSASASAQTKWPTQGWAIAKPADVGVDATQLDAFSAEIAAGKHGYVDSMLVIRCGQIAFEKSFPHDYDKIYGEQARKPGPLNHDLNGPYNYFSANWHPFYKRGELHTMQSVTKTVTSVVFGVAMARKDFSENLDEPILKYFDGMIVANVDERKRRITLRHMLTMTAGFDWNEDGPYNDPSNSADIMESKRDWVRYAIDLPMAHEPGARYQYSSGVSQLLSHIFKKATGQDIQDYAKKHLLSPLGIDFFWKRTPTGLSDTEGGLYLKARDLAKIGYLFLKNGQWNGKQLLKPEWVKASVAPSSTPGGGMKYGFQWWLLPHGENQDKLAWTGSGFGGQRLFVVPKQDLIVVYTGWSILSPPLNGRTAFHRVTGAVSAQSCGAQAK